MPGALGATWACEPQASLRLLLIRVWFLIPSLDVAYILSNITILKLKFLFERQFKQLMHTSKRLGDEPGVNSTVGRQAVSSACCGSSGPGVYSLSLRVRRATVLFVKAAHVDEWWRKCCVFL